MKALITAGGRATRLRPITHTINKHLIPLANKPMIFHAIEKVAHAGVTEIIINTNPGDEEVAKYVGDGARWGVSITFREQVGGPQGVAHIPTSARDLLEGVPFLFYLGDNIILSDIKEFVDQFHREGRNAMLAFSKVKDPERFGVPEFDTAGNLVRVVEKPKDPKSDFAVTGIYLYDGNYFKAFDSLTRSSRGEYEISDIHSWYLQNNLSVGWKEITGWWKDTGKPEDLLEGNQLLAQELAFADGGNEGEVEPSVRLQGHVKIGRDTLISGNTLLRGPVIIGEGCTIVDSYIGPYTSIGDRSQIQGSEVEHSLIFSDVHIKCPTRIVDSIIGQNATIVSAHKTFPLGHKLIIGDNTWIEI